MKKKSKHNPNKCPPEVQRLAQEAVSLLSRYPLVTPSKSPPLGEDLKKLVSKRVLKRIEALSTRTAAVHNLAVARMRAGLSWTQFDKKAGQRGMAQRVEGKEDYELTLGEIAMYSVITGMAAELLMLSAPHHPAKATMVRALTGKALQPLD
jgi:hypothetical protein